MVISSCDLYWSPPFITRLQHSVLPCRNSLLASHYTLPARATLSLRFVQVFCILFLCDDVKQTALNSVDAHVLWPLVAWQMSILFQWETESTPWLRSNSEVSGITPQESLSLSSIKLYPTAAMKTATRKRKYPRPRTERPPYTGSNPCPWALRTFIIQIDTSLLEMIHLNIK